MFTEKALEKRARQAILARGRLIARRGFITHRSCRYDGELTHLSALVEGSQGFNSYHTSLTVDEQLNRVVSYSCECPAFQKYAGPCKHAMALGYDFLLTPTAYQGYSDARHVVTSPELMSFFERTQRVSPVIPLAQVEPHGAVSLALTLTYDAYAGDCFVRFHIAGRGGRYVIKNIGDFADSVRTGALVTYGKKLTVLHDEASFEPFSWRVAQWIVRGVRNRQAFVSEKYSGLYYRVSSSGTGGSTGRELRLSAPEVDELLELFEAHALTFSCKNVDATRSENSKDTTWDDEQVVVTHGDPALSVEIREAGSGSYELVRHGDPFVMFSTGRFVYAVQQGTGRLLRCSEHLFDMRDFVQNVYCSPAEHLMIAADDAERFAVTVLPVLEQHLDVAAPSALTALRPVAGKVAFYLDCDAKYVTASVVASYGDQAYPLQLAGIDDGHDLRRDSALEASARQLVSQYFIQKRTSLEGQALWVIPKKDADAVARLIFGGVSRMSEMGEVFRTQAFDRLISHARPRVHMGVSVESHLVKLHVSTDDLPLSELYAVLASYRKKKTYHRLRDGSFLRLGDLDLSAAAVLADELDLTAAQLASGMVEMPSYKAFLLETVLHEDEKDDAFDEWLEAFHQVDPRSYTPPTALASILRPYQIQGFQWLCALAEMGFGGILADEMGLGKTVQLIAFLLAHRGQGQSLVVCPASLVYNWQAEFETFAPDMDVALVVGTAAQRRTLRAEAGHEVLVTSYDLMRRDVEAYAEKEFFCMVLDEAQYIKNHQTLAARAAKAISARHRFALTGTPIENRLSELWSIFDYLMPGFLGRYEHFHDRYEAPIVAGDDEVAAQLHALIGPFVLRRLKRDVLTDLPDKLEMQVVARMAPEQAKLYHAHEQALRLSILGKGDAELGVSKLQILAELTRLRQLCCDPRLVYENYRGGSGKLDTIWELIAASVDAGAKALVFSQFTSFLALIAERLKAEHVSYYELTGTTPKEHRVELVNEFNDDDTPIFLISLKAGGTGLNLTGAQVVIHADPWWNVATENQATDRAHRIGQERDVTVYKVTCKDTIEERIVALQMAKVDLADAVVGTGEGLSLGSLEREDLLRLLG